MVHQIDHTARPGEQQRPSPPGQCAVCATILLSMILLIMILLIMILLIMILLIMILLNMAQT